MVTCRQQSGCFLLVVFFAVAINSVKFSRSYEIPAGTKLELRKWVSRPASQLDRVKLLLHSDAVRLRAISRKVGLKHGGVSYEACANRSRTTKGGHHVFGEMPLNSAADRGSGQYLVHFDVGSPAQRVVLVADTGSDLTWMKCKFRCHGGKCSKDSNRRRAFRADRSATFKTLPCSSRTCRIELANLFSLARCPSPMEPCAFDYRYSDGSYAQGLFANETITFRPTNGRKTKLHNILIGCSETSSGQSFQSADGVIGLGHSNQSFAVKAAKHFGGKFSYCLVDHLSPRNKSSFLIFGSHKHAATTFKGKMRYTKLVLGVIDPFYAVRIKGISIGGAMLEIPVGVFNVNSTGGTIIDSGSSLTSLTLPAYNPVMDLLKLSLLNFRNLNLDIGPLEYCFNSTGFEESLVPRLVFHFTDGARFEPPVKSYVIDVAPGVKCVGLIPAAWPGASVIGNIMQQNHLWEFDLVNGRLGFASSSCT